MHETGMMSTVHGTPSRDDHDHSHMLTPGSDGQAKNRLRKACDSCSIRKVKVSLQYAMTTQQADVSV